MTQADTNTTQTAEQPTQTQSTQAIEVQANIKTDTIMLERTDIYARMTKSSDLLDYSATSKRAGQKYALFTYGGAVITGSEEFTEAFEKREIMKVTLTGRPYTRDVPDPNNAGLKKTITSQSYTIDGFESLADYKKAKVAELKFKKVDMEIAKASKAIEAIDITAAMSDAELEALLKNA